jgi:hypothetical protein
MNDKAKTGREIIETKIESPGHFYLKIKIKWQLIIASTTHCRRLDSIFGQ